MQMRLDALSKHAKEKKGKELLRESRAASPRGFSESAIESVDRFSGSFLSFWTNDTTRLLQPTFTLAYTRYFGMPAPIVRGHIGRQIFRSSGEPARAGGRRHNEHDVFVDRWAARLEATTCDDGYNPPAHRLSAHNSAVDQVGGGAGQS